MRMQFRLPIAAVCVLALALVGCSTTGDRIASSTKTADSDLERAIQSRWAEKPAFQDLRVSANAEKNQATLSGTVASEDLRTQAVDLAKAEKSGLVVTDAIKVKPPEVSRSEFPEDLARDAREKAKAVGDKIGNSLDDAWIHSKIAAKLLGDRGAQARKINIDVMDQVVTLRGKVESDAAKSAAERIAKETDGVKRVVNLLKVAFS